MTSRTKPLCTCTSNPCFRSATGVSTCSLVGSSLEPAAGSTSPAASTWPRAVCMCFCCTLGLYPMRSCLVVLVVRLWVSLWQFAGPCGVSLALRVALGIHCGTLGVHFDTHGVQLGVFWALWGDLGASFGHPWAPFGYPWGPCWCLVGTLGCGPGPLGPLL